MALDLTTADAALKDDYQPLVREQLNHKVAFLDFIETNEKDTEGRNAVLSLHTGRNSGVGARAELGDLPTAGNQSYEESRVGMAYNYGRIQVSGITIQAMKSDKGSFIRAVESETKGVVTDLRRDVNRQLFNDSTQSIAECGTTAAATTVQLAADTTLTQMRQFEVGMVVDIGTTANPTSEASARTIEAIDRANLTIEISGAAVDTAASDFVTRSGAAGNELTGLREIVNDSGTLFGVDPTSVTSWVSQVFDNSGTPRAATDTLFESVVDEVMIESGEDPNLVVWSFGVQRNYAAQLKDDKRYTDTVELKSGYTLPALNNSGVQVGFMRDRDVPEGTAFVLNSNHLQQYQMSDWSFMDEDGAVLSRVANKHAYEATLFKLHLVATDKRNAHARVDDLTES